MFQRLEQIDKTDQGLDKFREKVMSKRVNLNILSTKHIISKQIFND